MSNRLSVSILVLLGLLLLAAATDQYGAAAWRWIKFRATHEAIPEDFTSGSTTLGFQEAIDWICASGETGHGAVLRLGGKVYDFGASASMTVPVNCDGFTMVGTAPDTYNGVIGAGTELKTSLNGDFITLTGALRRVHLADFQITATPGASTRLIVGGSLLSKFHFENIRCSKGGAASANGVCIHLTDPVKGLVSNSESELLGAGFVVTGTLGSGGTVFDHNRLETQGNSTGVGLLIGEGNYACTNILLTGNIFEGNNIGLKIDTTASGSKSCVVTDISPHYENSIGSNYEDVRATGANSYLRIGGYSAGAGSGAEKTFHRTTQTDSAATDIFVGGALYGTITMDAGVCMIHGVSDWYSGGDTGDGTNPCTRMGADAAGFYFDWNHDGNFDLGTDSRIGRSTAGTATPTDGSTACETNDDYLETDAFKFYRCVDGATDKWYGVQLVDTP